MALRYVDEAGLSGTLKGLVRTLFPSSALLLPAAFFVSVLSPTATEPDAFIYLAYLGAVLLAVGLVILGVGLIRTSGESAA